MDGRDKSELLKKLVDGKALPALSPLVVRLIQSAADDDSSAADLAAIIEKDPGLATRLLKLVGSAFFARPQQVVSIGQAVVRVGFKRVRLMALSLSLRDTFPMGRRGNMDFDYFWKTSLYRALIAQDFVRYGGFRQAGPSDEVFVSALILEIGLLLLWHLRPGEFEGEFPGLTRSLDEITAWEDDRLGINHRELGAVVLRRWHFPEDLVETQRCFGPDALSLDSPGLCKVVELARCATEAVFGGVGDLYQVQARCEGTLSLTSEAVNEILSEAFAKVESLAAQLRIETDSQADILGVMERANQALARINTSMETSLKGLLDQVTAYDRSLKTATENNAITRRDVLVNTLDAVAHEIRNPLLAIGGFAKRLSEEVGEGDRSVKYASIIVRETARLEHKLNEILGYCRDYEPRLIENDLNRFVEDVAEEFRKEGGLPPNAAFSVRASAGRLRVRIDPEGMARALRRLLRTAVRMAGEGQAAVNLTVEPLPKIGQAVVTVSDSGPPMSDTIRDALLNSNLSAKTFGEGLELPMVRKIVEAHNGRIELEIPKSGGNIVRLYLPMS